MRTWLLATIFLGAACTLYEQDDEVVTCGPGTLLDVQRDVCVPADSLGCGPGTHPVGNVCVPDLTTTCGEGTHAVDGTCVPDGTLTCGAGTHAVDGMCVPDGTLTCGAGTHAADGMCVPDQLTCGAGTHPQGGLCVPDGGYLLRVVAPTVAADGYSKIPVIAIGTDATGAPSTEPVVLQLSRSNAGTLLTPQVALLPTGRTIYFQPCNSNTAGCLGPVTVTMARASAPTTPIASVTVELVAPTGVSSAAPCLTGGNVMFFDGTSYIYNGMLRVEQGRFSASTATARELRLSVDPSSQSQGLWWYLTFSTDRVPTDLVPGVYTMAERAPFASAGRPGIDVSGDGRGCNTIAGRFQVHEYQRSATGAFERATVSFEQFCEQQPSNVLRGCIHVEP